MKKMLVLSFTVALGMAAATPAVYAQPWCGSGHCSKPPCPPPCFKEVPLAVTVVNKDDVETCECYRKKVWPITTKEVKGCVWEDTLICRSVVHEVPVCKTVPVCVKDPCTGCTRTEYHEETCMEKVVSKEYAIIPVKQEYDYNLVSFDDYVHVMAHKKCRTLTCEPQVVTTKVPCEEPAPACPAH